MLRVADRRRAALLRRFFLRLIVLSLSIVPPARGATEVTLLLDVRINGFAIDRIGTFVLRDGVLLSRREELHDLGFRVPTALPTAADGLIALSDLSSVRWQLDLAAQSIAITADDDRLLPAVLAVQAGPQQTGHVESGTGATLDYDISHTSARDRGVSSALLDMRGFSPRGVVSSGMLAYAGRDAGGAGTRPVVRLDSTYTYSDSATLTRVRVGDLINGGLAWTRPVRLGGVQFGSDFALRPDLVTFPLPSVSGSVAVPSTLDVLVNGTRLMSRTVEPGPFEIPQLPVVTGAGTVSMTVTNALGRQVVTTLPFYASSALLSPGLQTYSVQAGVLRRNWGVVSNDYGGMAASATYRRGISQRLTLEGSSEVTRGTAMAGAGAVVNAYDFAVLTASAAASGGPSGGGGQFSAGVQRIGTVFSVNASMTMASPKYRDIAAVNGDSVPRLQFNTSAGLSLGGLGSLGVAYIQIRRDATLDRGGLLAGAVDLRDEQRVRILSASYSAQLKHLSFYATAFKDFAQSGSRGVLFGVTFPLGRSNSVSASLGLDGSGTSRQVQAQQSASEVGDWGYQAYAASGMSSHQFAQVQYKSPWALLTAGADRFDGQTSLAFETSGSVSFVDGAVFASNTIPDSFAIVDTNGLAGVLVLRENREAGRTNAAGKLLVPDLRSFDVNRLAIEATDVPADTTIDVSTREVRPQDRSGVIVRFPVKVSHGALLVLVDEAGVPLPISTTVTLRATGAIVPVGYDGNAYVQDLAPHNDVQVERADGRRCSVAFEYKPVPGEIPTIGPLVCR